LVGKKYHELTPAEYWQRETKIVENVVRTGKAAEHEKQYVRKDGSRVPSLLTTFPVMVNDGKPLAAIIRDLTNQKDSQDLMRLYISEIIRAQEEERSRIARDLHDETAQALVSLQLDIERIKRSCDSLPEAGLLLDELRAKVDATLVGVRRLTHELRPPVLDQLGLFPALELLTSELNSKGIRTRIDVAGCERHLNPDEGLALFRITQEALHNVSKHARATEVVVSVQITEKSVKLHVIDNGCGFEVPERIIDFAGMGKVGLIGIEERVTMLGGTLIVKSQCGRAQPYS